MSKIEWTNKTWNPITGCTPISEGCNNCYAKAMNKRFGEKWGNPDFKVKFHPERLDQPLKKKKPTLYFVCSMGDLFHYDVSYTQLEKIINIISECKQHHFLVLTKRPQIMKSFFEVFAKEIKMPLNLWLGVTAENQKQADKRIPILLDITAAGHFISLEPLLGEVIPDLCNYGTANHSDIKVNIIKWVIAGKETGTGARPMKQEWIDKIRTQVEINRIPFFHKNDENFREVPKELERFF